MNVIFCSVCSVLKLKNNQPASCSAPAGLHCHSHQLEDSEKLWTWTWYYRLSWWNWFGECDGRKYTDYFQRQYEVWQTCTESATPRGATTCNQFCPNHNDANMNSAKASSGGGERLHITVIIITANFWVTFPLPVQASCAVEDITKSWFQRWQPLSTRLRKLPVLPQARFQTKCLVRKLPREQQSWNRCQSLVEAVEPSCSQKKGMTFSAKLPLRDAEQCEPEHWAVGTQWQSR